MTRIAYVTLAVICGFAVQRDAAPTSQAAEVKIRKQLNLETAYFEKPILANARTVGLEAELDDQGGGRGTLVLDPNIRHGKVSTLMADTVVKVTLTKITDGKHDKEGRQVYEIRGKGLERLRVAVPEKGDGPCLLLIGSKDGKDNVIEMRRK